MQLKDPQSLTNDTVDLSCSRDQAKSRRAGSRSIGPIAIALPFKWLNELGGCGFGRSQFTNNDCEPFDLALEVRDGASIVAPSVLSQVFLYAGGFDLPTSPTIPVASKLGIL